LPLNPMLIRVKTRRAKMDLLACFDEGGLEIASHQIQGPLQHITCLGSDPHNNWDVQLRIGQGIYFSARS
jgi:hypothetical protein